MSGVQIVKLVSSFSLLALIVLARASTYREFASAIRSVTAEVQLERIAASFEDLLQRDGDLADAIARLGDGTGVADVKRMVALRAASESPLPATATSQAVEIKSNPLYRDPGIQEQSNWLAGAIKRLLDLIPKKGPNVDMRMPQSNIPGWIVPGMWVLLAAGVLVFGYFALRHFSWKRALTKKARAILEDDEPHRTLDEWLALADEHSAAGRYREAVRAMYLSCLLKFDEAGIARFIRGETNWEHLARIGSSIKKPATIDFRPPTQSFDRIWYGFHVKGREDVDQFRVWYQQIVEALRGVGK